jgi:hypothetical protein
VASTRATTPLASGQFVAGPAEALCPDGHLNIVARSRPHSPLTMCRPRLTPTTGSSAPCPGDSRPGDLSGHSTRPVPHKIQSNMRSAYPLWDPPSLRRPRYRTTFRRCLHFPLFSRAGERFVGCIHPAERRPNLAWGRRLALASKAGECVFRHCSTLDPDEAPPIAMFSCKVSLVS